MKVEWTLITMTTTTTMKVPWTWEDQVDGLMKILTTNSLLLIPNSSLFRAIMNPIISTNWNKTKNTMMMMKLKTQLNLTAYAESSCWYVLFCSPWLLWFYSVSSSDIRTRPMNSRKETAFKLLRTSTLWWLLLFWRISKWFLILKVLNVQLAT